MSRWTPITYRDFWDVPRIFFFEVDGHYYLFDCRFDEETEDYPDDYRVYLMPELAETDYAGSWAGLDKKAIRELGTVPVEQVTFDPTKRKQVNTAILDGLTVPARTRD